jgi:hypothetical protein
VNCHLKFYQPDLNEKLIALIAAFGSGQKSPCPETNQTSLQSEKPELASNPIKI